MSNFTIGLTGLQNTADAIDTTSNNIANANTVGYKAREYVFADQYFKAVSASDSNRIGQGAQRLAVRHTLSYGSITNSNNPLDMAVSGDGWFRTLSDKNDMKTLNYTRNGQFSVAKDGFIVNQNGQYLTGYQATPDRSGITDDLGTLSMPPTYDNGVHTSFSRIDAVLDSRENAFTSNNGVAFDPAQKTYNAKTTQTVYDTNGAGHTLEVYYRRVTDSQLKIQSTADGYIYQPGPSSKPNTLGATNVVIPITSILSVQTAPSLTLLSKSSAQNGITGGGSIELSTDLAQDLTVGDKVFINGVDYGFTIASDNKLNKAGQKIIKIAGPDSKDIPPNATISIYKGDTDFDKTVITVTSAGSNELKISGATTGLIGQRLFINQNDTTASPPTSTPVDTGLTVQAVDAETGLVTLNGKTSIDIDADDTVTFKPELSMTLIAPDGHQLTVKGTTNKQTSGTILTATQANVEVYASIDGVFYNREATSNTTYGQWNSSKDSRMLDDVQNSSGYQSVAHIGLVNGRNVDSLVLDSSSGEPLFSTNVTLTHQVLNGAQQSTLIPLIYDLDLSNTELRGSSFQVNASVQNGEPRSQLASVSIDDSGNIVGIYGNGRQLYAGQVVLAHFEAAEQLVPTGANSFAPSYMSGSEGSEGVYLGRPGEGSFGSIKSQAVEQSNVDLSNELVKLMILQRMYSANSQSLRAFDSTMQDTIRMMS